MKASGEIDLGATRGYEWTENKTTTSYTILTPIQAADCSNVGGEIEVITAAYAASSPATNIADLALLNRYEDTWGEMIDGEHGSRVGNKSEGGSRGVDKREEPSASATEIGETTYSILSINAAQ